ncbi:MAG: endonuclease/exonuclease/phosphatase family protein [Pseudomonadota bacterium]
MADLFRVVAWNIRAGGGTRAVKISRSILKLNPDVVILSEYRSTQPSQNIAQVLAQHDYLHQSTTTSEVAPTRNALLIAARSPFIQLALDYAPDEPGRWNILRLSNPDLLIAGMHIPNQHTGRKPQYHEAVLTTMRHWRDIPAIFAGDTNSGRKGEDEETAVFNNRTTAWFDQIEAAGWRDAFRLVHGPKREFTWYSPGHNNGFRLDQAFISPRLVEHIIDVRHLWVVDEENPNRRDAMSDHAALIIDVDIHSLG